jgi:hypothetical protein
MTTFQSKVHQHNKETDSCHPTVGRKLLILGLNKTNKMRLREC